MVLLHAALLAAVPLALAQSSTSETPPAPSLPNSPLTNAKSPPEYPSPWGEGLGDWAASYEKARAFVKGLSLIEKVNLTTGVGWEGEKCVGNVGSLPRLGFKALCLQDSPLGVRFADYASAFSAGVTVAATWDRQLLYQRGFDMGTEHRLKGVDIQLGPVVGPLGRAPEGGTMSESKDCFYTHSDPWLQVETGKALHQIQCSLESPWSRPSGVCKTPELLLARSISS